MSDTLHSYADVPDEGRHGGQLGASMHLHVYEDTALSADVIDDAHGLRVTIDVGAHYSGAVLFLQAADFERLYELMRKTSRGLRAAQAERSKARLVARTSEHLATRAALDGAK